MRLLLKRDDVNPNISDMVARTALSWAAGNGHEGIVKLLLERKDIDPNAPSGRYDQTPLF